MHCEEKTVPLSDDASGYSLVYAGISDTGETRDVNEDYLLIIPEKKVFAVADGVGGMSAGDVASKMLASGIEKQLNGSSRFFSKMLARFTRKNVPLTAFKEMVERENRRIYLKSKELKRPMASTIVLIQFQGLELDVHHVGDSRAYMLRDKEFTQITSDHSLVNDLYLQGQIKYEEMRTHPSKNIITRAVGSNKTVVPDSTSRTVNPGDILLLCSDGLTSMLTDEEIAAVLTSEQNSLYDTVKILIEQANDAGGTDNITVVLVRVESDQSA